MPPRYHYKGTVIQDKDYTILYKHTKMWKFRYTVLTKRFLCVDGWVWNTAKTALRSEIFITIWNYVKVLQLEEESTVQSTRAEGSTVTAHFLPVWGTEQKTLWNIMRREERLWSKYSGWFRTEHTCEYKVIHSCRDFFLRLTDTRETLWNPFTHGGISQTLNEVA